MSGRPHLQAEAALPASLTQALSAVSMPVLAHAGHSLLFANEAMLRLLGVSAEMLGLMSHEAWATEEDRERLKTYGERCLREDGDLPALELRARAAHGTERQLEITARCLKLDDGRRIAVLSCQDLSDMQHVQHSLLQVGRVLHQIIENGPVATFVIDAEHRITHWNAACARLSGKSSGEMLGRTEAWRGFYPQARPLLADLIVDGEVEAHRRLFPSNSLRESKIGPGSYEAEEQVELNGQLRWIFASATPLLDIEGRMIGAVETLLDMSERRNAEEALRRHQTELEAIVQERSRALHDTHQELDALLHNAEVGIVASSHAQLVTFNRNFAQMFELGDAPVGQLTARDFFPDDAAYLELSQAVARALRRGESLHYETTLVTRTGRRRWVQMTAYSASPEAPMEKVWWLMQDRSEYMRAQQELVENFQALKRINARLEEAQNQLLQSEKMASIGQLAAGVAHEINNPIAFVSSNLASLRRYAEPLLALLQASGATPLEDLPPALRERLQAMGSADDRAFLLEDLPQLLNESQDGLDRVTKIVHDLKDFSRVDNADWQDADLNQGLESTLNVVMNEVKYKAEIVRHYGTLPRVRCLAGQLNQVFMNLIVNAAHAIDGRGRITLSTRAQDGWVCIEVADTGRGMSAEVQRRIFEPFYTTKPVGQGTGLGLSLSFSIIKKHGGRFEVDSTPGEGSCFRVWVPVQGPTAA
ncbi:PAS domain S-box protein [Pelomonas sp. V22]|uniref:PAS domain-containing sensor histidine kinase n=1 Tax=Pelomonas sp. V22 TaxID=2822139 RepID=UPI0024A998A2|nr:PAS domain S-box protein [Pelomonas sp. V22]MDI4634867.1 PAS domain S-box protein [Pelomonas sp. V22]